MAQHSEEENQKYKAILNHIQLQSHIVQSLREREGGKKEVDGKAEKKSPSLDA